LAKEYFFIVGLTRTETSLAFQKGIDSSLNSKAPAPGNLIEEAPLSYRIEERRQQQIQFDLKRSAKSPSFHSFCSKASINKWRNTNKQTSNGKQTDK